MTSLLLRNTSLANDNDVQIEPTFVKNLPLSRRPLTQVLWGTWIGCTWTTPNETNGGKGVAGPDSRTGGGVGPAGQIFFLDLPNYDRFMDVVLQHPESLVRCGFVWP